jgi:hypothetical protein
MLSTMVPMKAKQSFSWLFFPKWILANSIGLGLGFGLARVVALAMGGDVFMDTGAPSYGFVNGTVAWIIVGMVLGAAHWFVLHQYVRRALWWVFALIFLLTALAAWGGYEDGRVTIPWIPGGVMYGAVLGVVSGIPLTWLLRR